MDDKIIVQLDHNSNIEETEKTIQNNLINLEEEEKKPLEDRVSSKEWRVRKNAYVEVLDKLTSNMKTNRDYYLTYNFVYQKILDESNPNCQENGIDILKLIVENYNVQESQIIEFFKQIIEKLCSSQKTPCKMKARELILYIYENSNNQALLLEMFKLLLENKKRIAVVISSLDIIFLIINEFGSTQFDYAALMPFIIKANEFSNPAIKNWVLEIIKSLYKWIKEDLKPLLVGIKDSHLKEINSILTKLANTEGFNELKLIPKRYLKMNEKKSPQEKKEVICQKINTVEKTINKIEKIDSYFILTLDKFFFKDEVNLNEIFSEDLKSHFNKINSNHNEKMKIINYITQKIHNKILIYNNIEPINSIIKELVKDSNNLICQSAIKLISGLSICLNRQFIGCKEFFPLICEKLKEKNEVLRKDIMTCLINIITYNNSLGEYVDLIENMIDDASLSLKTTLCEFLLRGITKTYINTLKKFSFEIVELASRLTEDENEEVQDLAINCVSILKVRLGRNFSEKIYNEISEENKMKIEREMKELKCDKMYDDEEYIEPEINLSEKRRKKEVELVIYQRKNKENSTISNKIEKIDKIEKLDKIEKIDKIEIIDKIENKYNTNKRSDLVELKLDDNTDPKKNYETERTNKVNLVVLKDKNDKIEEIEKLDDIRETLNNTVDKIHNEKLPFDERPVGTKNKNIQNLNEFPNPDDDNQLIKENKSKVEIKNPRGNTKIKNQKDQKDQIAKIDEQMQITEVIEQKVIKKNEKPKPAKSETKIADKADSKKPDKDKEEDEDTKVTIEDIEEKINGIMESLDLKTLFSSTKWEERKKAFCDMNKFIKENPDKVADMTENLILYIKNKLKDWKENNINLNKEAISLLILIITDAKAIDKKIGRNIIKGFHERLSDKLVKEYIINLYLILMEHLTPSFTLNILLTLLKNSKSPNLLKDYASFLEKTITEFGINLMPVKEIVEFCKNLANHTNPQVRTSATTLLCELYKYIGKDLLIMLKDIKESTLKIIEDAFNEVKVISNKNEMEKPKRIIKSNGQTINTSQNALKAKNKDTSENTGLLNFDLIPRADISKKILPKFLKDINNGKWNEKKEAIESLEKILTEANNRILPIGLNDLFVAIKAKLGDGNKNFVRLLLTFLTKLIDGLGNPFKNFAKGISAALISCLADKQQALRDDVVICIDKWISKVDFSSVVIYFPTYLKQDNFEMRTEILKIIMRNKESFIKCDLKEFVNPLLLCLQDKTISIRTVAEEIIAFTLKNLSINAYYNSLKDFKPAIVNSIKPLLDKYRLSGEEGQIKVNDRKIGSSSDKICVYDEDKQMTTSPSQRKIGKKLSKDKVSGSTNNKKLPKAVSQPRDNNKTPIYLEDNNNYGTNSMYKSISPKNFNPYGSIFVSVANSKQLKEKRLEMDKKIKFNIEQITDDIYIKIKDQMKNLILIDVVDKMFSDDLKTNIEAFSIFQNSLKNEINLFLDCFDLILKWVIIKSSTQQNPIFIKALIEFFETILYYISEKEYKLSDNESLIIIFTLIDKFSVAKLKENLKGILEKYEIAISPYRMFSQLMICSINKNPKIKCECLDICSSLIAKHGIGTASFKDIKSIAKILESNDNALKNSALYLLIEAYKQLKDNFWSILNDIPVKSKDMLESKINLVNMEEASSNKKAINRSQILLSKDKIKDKSFDNDSDLKQNSSFDTKKNKNTNSQILSGTSPKKLKELEKNPSNEDMAKLKGNFDLLSYLSILENGEAKERVNILIILNDLISSIKTDNSKSILLVNLDLIIKTFINCLQSSFDKSINEIPIKFGKYLLTVLYKICCLKDLIIKISYKVLFELCEEVLSKLLIDNLDKIGENQEGKIILKSLNGTMLRVLENCSPTDIFSVLIELVRKYRTSATTPRIAGLAIKCLLKLTQIINQIINEINIETILVKIHEFIADMEQTNPDLNPKHQNDELSLRIIKTIINELVKIKKEEINEIYNRTVEKYHIKEIQIKKWISIILKSISTTNIETQPVTNPSNKSALPKESIVILEELTKQSYENFELNNSKIQMLFGMFTKANFDFKRLNNVIDSKLYDKLIPLWEYLINNNTEKSKTDHSPGKKYNNIDNLIEYKNKLQEITKQYKQQQIVNYDKDKLKINEGHVSPKRNVLNSKKELQNSEVYNKISNLKSKLSNYNDKQNNLNKTLTDEAEPKNAYNKMNDLKKKLKDISSNNNGFLSTSNLGNIEDIQSNETPSQNTTGLNSYQNDTLSKLSEIKNKLNTFKKNSLNNAHNK